MTEEPAYARHLRDPNPTTAESLGLLWRRLLRRLGKGQAQVRHGDTPSGVSKL
jgi:hypothetical protein